MSAPTPLDRILLYVDATEEAISAARYAVALAKRYGGQLTAVYVVNVGILQELFRARVFVEDEGAGMEQDLEDDGRDYLRYVEELGRAKGLLVLTEMRKGVVHAEVVNLAQEMRATLIVLGAFDEPLSRRDACYSESEMILFRAPCPVAVVKGDDLATSLYDGLQ